MWPINKKELLTRWIKKVRKASNHWFQLAFSYCLRIINSHVIYYINSCIHDDKYMLRVQIYTSHSFWSSYCPRGSKLFRILPLKRVGSWGIMLSFNLRSFRPMVQMSRPSIRILPPAGSTNRNKALISVVFPLPVLPTTPILCPAGKVQVIPFRTSGACKRYFICNPTAKWGSGDAN